MSEGIQMMRRNLRFFAVLLCIGLATCILAGCFGSSDEPVNPTTPVSDSSSGATASTLSVPTTEASNLIDGLPAQFVNSRGQRPIVVVFYAPGGVDDEKVLTAVRQLETSFSSYTFLLYDYRTPSAYGDLAKTLNADYELSVGYLPVTMVITRDGTPGTRWSGYVDKGTLNQVLINLGHF
jgi:hypothetical protein